MQRSSTTLGHALIELFLWKNIRRTAMAIMVMQVGILSGSLAIQNYQSLLYASLGYHGRSSILISGCYGFMGIAGQIINLLGVSDRWSRTRTMCKLICSKVHGNLLIGTTRARMSCSRSHALHPHGPLEILWQRTEPQRCPRWHRVHLSILRSLRSVLQLHTIHHRSRNLSSTLAWLWNIHRGFVPRRDGNLAWTSYSVCV